MGELVALYGYRWAGVVTLLFSDNEYDTPDLQIGPFRSKQAAKSWKRKFVGCLKRICRKMPNIKKCNVSFEETGICRPATDETVPPEDPHYFSREFLKIALRDWIILNPRNYPRLKARS